MTDDITNNKKGKYRPAGKKSTLKICVAQIVKGKEKELEALSSEEIKSLVPPELLMGIQAYDGGYQQDRTN